MKKSRLCLLSKENKYIGVFGSGCSIIKVFSGYRITWKNKQAEMCHMSIFPPVLLQKVQENESADPR